MSQHISGHVGQSVSHDYGEFIQVGITRMRKSLITGYALAGPINDPEKQGDVVFAVNVMMSGSWVTTGSQTTREEAEKELLRLDWIFKREEQ